MAQDAAQQGTVAAPEPRHAAAAKLPFELRDGDDEVAIKLGPWFVRDQKVFVDTGSFQVSNARGLFVDQLIPLLDQLGKEVLISDRTIRALQASSSHADASRAQHSKDALAIIAAMSDAKRLIHCADPHEIPGDPHDTFGLYSELFIGFQLKSRLCLITQNESTALQVIKNSRSKAFKNVRHVLAVYVEDGRLKNWVPRLLERAGHSVQPSGGQSQALESVITRGFKIVADTSSLLVVSDRTGKHVGVEFFGETLLPLLERHSNVLIVPTRVTHEVKKHAASDDAALRDAATAGLVVLQRYIDKGRLVVGQDEHELEGHNRTFADPVFVRLALRFHGEHDLCFITQDTQLAKTLLENRVSGGDRQFLVTYVDRRQGRLMRWEPRLARQNATGSDEKDLGKSQDSPRMRSEGESRREPKALARHQERVEGDPPPKLKSEGSAPPRPKPKPFLLVATVTPASDAPIPVAKIPGVGDTVIGTVSGPVQLIESIAEGGEGIVYRTGRAGVVCKIYHAERLTTSRRHKLELMVTRDVRIRGVCWPTELVRNLNGEFVGYLMPKADGKIFKTAVLAKPLLQKTFPHWTREHLTQLAVTVLRTIAQLHELNVLIGDINPQNILVVGEREISIIDADS